MTYVLTIFPSLGEQYGHVIPMLNLVGLYYYIIVINLIHAIIETQKNS